MRLVRRCLSPNPGGAPTTYSAFDRAKCSLYVPDAFWRCHVVTDRLDMLIEARQKTGFTLDYLEWVTRGLDSQASCILLGNLSTLPPQYVKSSGTP